MEISYIYKITSPSNKIYIGSTNNYNKRFNSYKKLRCKTQIKLYNSFLKHGIDSHKFEIIQECKREDRYKIEAYFGCIYNVISKVGLNLKLPKSDFYINVSEETKKKITEVLKGRPVSEETRKKISYANMGHIVTEETKNKISKKNKGKKMPKHVLDNLIKINKSRIVTDKERENKSKSRKGKNFSIQHRENIRKAHIGKKQTPEHIQNMKMAITGLKRTEETKKRISESKKNISILKADIFLDTINGIYFHGIKDACIFSRYSLSYFSKMMSGKIKNTTNIIKV
jgi:group I intron endonuclease